MNLREQLKETLPAILPEDPEQSIKGTELIRLVKYRLEQEYSDATLRYHFSILSSDPSSPIAKVEQGQGYYLRSPLSKLEEAGNLIRMNQGLLLEGEALNADQRLARAQRFAAFYRRFTLEQESHPFFFEHRSEGSLSRHSIWNYPDAVLVDWDLEEMPELGSRQELDRKLMEIKQHMGSQPFSAAAVKLSLSLDVDSYRESFFQAVSHSLWAHRGELVIASAVTDSQLVESLRRLGTEFDLSVISFGIDLEALDQWQDSEAIARMSAREFEALMEGVSLQKIHESRSRPHLDWSVLKQLRKESPDFEKLLSWIAECLDAGQPLPFDSDRQSLKAQVSTATAVA